MNKDYESEMVILYKMIKDILAFADKDPLTSTKVGNLAKAAKLPEVYSEENYTNYFNAFRDAVVEFTGAPSDSLYSAEVIYRAMLVKLLTIQIVDNSIIAKDTMNRLLGTMHANGKLVDTHLTNPRIASLISACSKFDDFQTDKLFYALKIILTESISDELFVDGVVNATDIDGLFDLYEKAVSARSDAVTKANADAMREGTEKAKELSETDTNVSAEATTGDKA